MFGVRVKIDLRTSDRKATDRAIARMARDGAAAIDSETVRATDFVMGILSAHTLADAVPMLVRIMISSGRFFDYALVDACAVALQEIGMTEDTRGTWHTPNILRAYLLECYAPD